MTSRRGKRCLGKISQFDLVRLLLTDPYFKNILFWPFFRYVRTSALSEELIYFNPTSSAHVAFKHYLEDSGVYTSSGKRRRRSRRRKSCDLEAAEGDLEASAADEMPIVITLAPNDIENVKSSWTTIESYLLQVHLIHKMILTHDGDLKRRRRLEMIFNDGR